MRINDLEYHIEEEGSGEPLLLLHGFTGSVRNWDDVAPQFAQRHRVIRVDLPGHGRTEFTPDPKRYLMSSTSQDLSRLLVALNASPAHVLGYSMGGRLALFFALNHANHVRSLIIESGSSGLATESERVARLASDAALAGRIECDGIEPFVDEWERLPLWAGQSHLPAAVKQRQRELRLRNDPRGLAMSLHGMGTGAQPSLWGELPNLRARTLFIAGEHDAKFVAIARAMQTRSPRARLEIIADAGHTTHIEQPEVFVEKVTQFLGLHP